MDVRLPDGTVVKGVPDGMSQADLTAKLSANGYDTSKLQPQESRGIVSQVGDAFNAAGHHIMAPLHGAAQLIQHGMASGANAIAPAEVNASNPNPSFLESLASTLSSTAASDDAAMRKWEADYQKNTPNSGGAYTGAVVGEVAPFLTSAVTKPLQYIGDLASKGFSNSLAKKIASGAAQGATVGAVQPVTGEGDYWDQKAQQMEMGGAFGGALPVAVAGLRNIASNIAGAAEPFINPAQAAAKKFVSATGMDPQALANALRNYKQYVPGSTPTTAQVIATPEAVQLEKAMRNTPEFAAKLEAVNNANNAARLDAVNSVAGAPGQLEAATAARNATANQQYQQAFNAPFKVTPQLQGQMDSLLQRPAIQLAFKEAQTLAQNEGIPLTNANSVRGLHYAKMALDDQISRAVRAGDNNTARVLTDGKKQLLDVMGNLSPEYRNAMETYAQNSVPVNTMQAGRDMQDMLWNRAFNSAGDPALQFQNFRTALAKALNGSEYGIDPKAQAVLEGVQNDLQRQTVSNSLRLPGSDTIYNNNAQSWLSRQIYGNGFTGSGGVTKAAGGVLGGGIGSLVGHPVAGAGIGAGATLGLSKIASSKVSNALSDIMLDPKKAADALAKLSPSERGSVLAKLLTSNSVMQPLLNITQNAP